MQVPTGIGSYPYLVCTGTVGSGTVVKKGLGALSSRLSVSQLVQLIAIMWQKGDPAGGLGIISRRARLCSIIIHEEEVAGRLLLHVHLRVLLVDARAVVLGVAAERDVQELEEAVHAREQTLRRVCRGLDTGPAIVDDDTIGEICRHDEVMLHHERLLLGVVHETLDHLAAEFWQP